MRKKIITAGACLFVLLFCLSACALPLPSAMDDARGEATLSFAKTEYELTVGESVLLAPVTNGKSITYYIEKTDVVSIDKENRLLALAEGTTSVFASADESDLVTLTVTVKAKTSEPTSEEIKANEEITETVCAALSDYYDDLCEENFTVRIRTSAGEQTDEMTLRIAYDPFYIESFSTDEKHPSVIKKEGDKVFSYTYQTSLFYGNYYQRRYLTDFEDLPSLSELTGIDLSDYLTVTFNPEKGSAAFDEQTGVYTFTALYADILGEATKASIETAMLSLGISTAGLDSVPVELTVKTGEEVTVSASLSVNVTYYGESVSVPISVGYAFSTEDFDEHDFSKENISRPSCLKEVDTSWTYDFTGDYTITGTTTDYLYVHLLPGQYVLKAKDGYNSYLKATLYETDEEESIVNLLGNGEVRFFTNSFIAPKEGDYFLVLQNSLSSMRTLRLNLLDYETLCESATILPAESNAGTLEGALDAVHYGGTAEEDGVVKITNTGETVLQFITEPYNDGWFAAPIEPGESFVLLAGKEGYDFFVCEKDGDGVQAYSFAFEPIENENGTEAEFENLDALTTEWSEKEYTAGYGIPDRAVKLHLDERSLVLLQSQAAEGFSDVTFAVEDTAGNRIETADGIAGQYLLNAGDYRVVVTNPKSAFGMAKIKYAAKDASDKDIAVVLSRYETAYDAEDGGYSGFYTNQLVSAQKVRYTFELTKNEILFFFESEVTVYTENGTILSLPTTAQNGYSYLSLPAGNYYCTVTDFALYAENEVPIAIVETGAESMRWNDIETVISGETYTFTKESNFDKEYLLIDAKSTAEWTISISGGSCRIYTADGAVVSKSSTNGFTLTAGKYVVVISYSRTASVSITLTGKAGQSGVGDL